jgi:hypothetical protein
MIAGIVLGWYALAWLATARALYGRWHGRITGARDCNTHGTEKERERRVLRHGPCCYDETHTGNGENAAFAMLTALLWPLVLFTAAVRFRPPPTAAERAAADAKLKARIAELERENGLTPR